MTTLVMVLLVLGIVAVVALAAALLRERGAARSAAERAAMAGAVEQLVRTNQEMLDAERRLGVQELEGRKTLIDEQVASVRAELARLSDHLHAVEAERREHVGRLGTQLAEAGRQTQALADTTRSLREALASTTARGQWGERMAEDVLSLAGFVDGVNYYKRRAMAGAGGIPDYTFLLPQGLHLHMDVKFPLDNYMRFLDASSDVERERYRKDFLRDVRLRLREVTSRGYVDPAASTVDCVLLFIPNEQVYGFIHEQDRTILDDALRDKVVFCSPLTLFAVLAVIRQAVDNFRLSQTSQEILALLAGFQKQWDKFADQMDKVGRSLRTASSAFDELQGTRTRMLERELDRIDDVRRRQSSEDGPGADEAVGGGAVVTLALDA